MAKAPAPANKPAAIAAGEREIAPELEADTTVPGDEPIPEGAEPPPAPIEEPPADRVPQRRMSPSDQARADIAARFTEGREAEPGDKPFSGDMNDPALMGAHAQQEEPLEPEPNAPEPGVPPTPEPAPQPRKIKVKVRGVEQELSEEEVVAAAQRGLAGDTYLEDARRLADDAARERQQNSARTSQSGEHPAGQEGANRETGEPGDGLEHPERLRPFKGLVEKLQYASDPEEIERELENTLPPLIDRAAQQQSRTAIVADRMRDELARSQHALSVFA